MPLWLNLTLIGVAGAAGALSRYGISVWMKSAFGDGFPYGTLLVNVGGCLVLGLMTEMLDEMASKNMRMVIGVGFLGALTTFSTFGVETIHKAHQGQLAVAVANVALNLVLGIGFAAIGIYLGRWLSGHSGI